LLSFLRESHPSIAAIVAAEIVRKTDLLADHPQLGKPRKGREEYRELVMQVVNARYVFQYRTQARGVVILRVFHGREGRERGEP
jgi:plasmid stabilization system protein ParE